MDSFPFCMSDVVRLLNLTIRRKHMSSIDVDCPFCNHKKGILNINLEKNVYRCNYCDRHGGMLSLYGACYNLSNQESYAEICELLRQPGDHADFQKVDRADKTMPLPQSSAKPAAYDEIHKTYSLLLSMLTLSQTHKEKLLARGLSEGQIEKYNYKSTPAYGFINIASELLNRGCVLEGVPGLFINDGGQWSVKFNSKNSGIIIPVTGIDGRIRGAQIRVDRPYNQAKYIWLSSAGEGSGASSGSPIHYVGNTADKIVYVTEGPLKATIAHCLSGKSFAAVAGANQYSNLPDFLKALKKNGAVEIVEAYDMDKCVNENVQNGCNQLYSLAREFGFVVHRIIWDARFKGIDDYLLNCRNKQILFQ